MQRRIAIVGPTASGKTRRAVEIARAFDGEIISCDSRQVYQRMTLGTGKDIEEYREIPYHLIDICKAGEKYNLHRFLTDYDAAEKIIINNGKRIIACGGSGMYIEAALNGLRLPEVPENMELRNELSQKSLNALTEILAKYKTLHNTTDVDNCKRAIRAIEIEEYYLNNPEKSKFTDKSKATKRDALIIGIDIPREQRRKRITERLYQRLDAGMIKEVEELINSGIQPEDLIYYGLEYKYLTLYLIGEMNKEDMITKLETAIHQFSKRQMTWLRGMQRRGFEINWIPYDIATDELIEKIRCLL